MYAHGGPTFNCVFSTPLFFPVDWCLFISSFAVSCTSLACLSHIIIHPQSIANADECLHQTQAFTHVHQESNPPLQFPPHHLLTLSPPFSSYSSRDIPTLMNSCVELNSAIPFQASSAASAACMTSIGISGERIGRNVERRRGMSPGSLEGDPVRNTF
jgi:hypothetical protein